MSNEKETTQNLITFFASFTVRLSADAEIKDINGKDTIAIRGAIQSQDRKGKCDAVQWVDVLYPADRAGKMIDYLNKGRTFVISGEWEIKQEEYKGVFKQRMSTYAQSITFAAQHSKDSIPKREEI